MRSVKTQLNKYSEVRKKVVDFVKKSCYSQNNYFQGRTWETHILPVVRHALKLANVSKADKEVVEMAAYLHDIANIMNIKYEPDHHIYGSVIAGNILKKYGFPEKKIEQVQYCILMHRGSYRSQRKSIEAKIVASADAMSHFTELVEMLYMVFAIRKFNSNEGQIWLKEKLGRSWRKIMPLGRRLIKKDYDIAMYLLNKNI